MKKVPRIPGRMPDTWVEGAPDDGIHHRIKVGHLDDLSIVENLKMLMATEPESIKPALERDEQEDNN
jgi:hypothetical protein